MASAQAVLAGAVASPGSPPRPAGAHQGALLLLPYLLHRGRVKPVHQAEILQTLATAPSGSWQDLLGPVWGGQEAMRVENMARHAEWPALEQWSVAARRRLLMGLARNPLRLVAQMAKGAGAALRRIRRPPGVMLVLMGPDGCGKSTIGAQLKVTLASLYAEEKTRHFHWRPGLLRPPRAWLSGPQKAPATEVEALPQGKAPYGKAVSFLRFLYFWADFVVGVPVRWRPVVAVNGLVVVDRYFFDFLVDPLRYRLNLPAGLVRLLGRFLVPSPDLVVILDAPEDTLLARKQELPRAELSRQRAAYRQLPAELPCPSMTLDTSCVDKERAAELIRDRIFQLLLARQGRE